MSGRGNHDYSLASIKPCADKGRDGLDQEMVILVKLNTVIDPPRMVSVVAEGIWRRLIVRSTIHKSISLLRNIHGRTSLQYSCFFLVYATRGNSRYGKRGKTRIRHIQLWVPHS